MADYKSIHFTIDFEVSGKVLDVVNDYLAQQPEPRPFVEPNSAGYVFYFHTLDIRLLQRNIEALTAQDLFSSNDSGTSSKTGQILKTIY